MKRSFWTIVFVLVLSLIATPAAAQVSQEQRDEVLQTMIANLRQPIVEQPKICDLYGRYTDGRWLEMAIVRILHVQWPC